MVICVSQAAALICAFEYEIFLEYSLPKTNRAINLNFYHYSHRRWNWKNFHIKYRFFKYFNQRIGTKIGNVDISVFIKYEIF